ncbi:MAG: hypothetical protein NTY67_00015 [Cyanobacteria bacterium]|nr:hypothetical protein [Cyanobacteriota bacterium]
MAEKYAAVAGGLSGATASAAVLTAGVGLPAAITAAIAEVYYTVRLQLRLAFDLHLVYDIPLAADDPEEPTRLYAVVYGVVYGVKIAEVGFSAGWNYATTRVMGARVRHGVRVSAALTQCLRHAGLRPDRRLQTSITR